MLCRWETEHGISGVGVDISEVFVGAASHRASELAVADRVLIEQGDAGAYSCEPGAFDVACCIGATWIGGGVAGAIDLLRSAVGADGLLLIGEPFWREEPPAAARAACGGSPDEFTDLSGSLEVFDTAWGRPGGDGPRPPAALSRLGRLCGQTVPVADRGGRVTGLDELPVPALPVVWVD